MKKTQWTLAAELDWILTKFPVLTAAASILSSCYPSDAMYGHNLKHFSLKELIKYCTDDDNISIVA